MSERTGLFHRRWLLLALFATLLPTDGMAGQQPTRIVYHINFDDPSHQISALHNMQNQISAANGKIKLLVVLHSAGLSLLLYPESLDHTTGMRRANGDQEMLARVDQLRDQGARFLVAANSTRRHHIDPFIDLHGVEPEDMVPSAFLELTHLQQQGYIYLKP